MKALTIQRKKYGVNIQEIYFSLETIKKNKCDLNINFCVDSKGKNTTSALTSIIDLTQETQKIISNFRLTHRRGIQVYLDSKDLNYKFITHPSSKDIQVFCKAYDVLAREKNLPPCNETKLRFFVGQDALIFTNVSCAITGELLCLHALICNGERARLLHAVSNFRSYADDSTKRNNLSKIHRALYWFEMNHFKKLGYKTYDLGGLGDESDPELEKINHFKRGFGGVDYKEYINFTPNNLKGWIAMHYLMKKL
ncbi:hypothetical protein [uncultured Thiothrix sp.]|uniref:hypothetical protein n=1 Tax=uncultured Thiothrix sp. TaxID=223185 RepID=UPI00260C44B0|nr:hypothetical protein [uncultured Thiothrix sp.]